MFRRSVFATTLVFSAVGFASDLHASPTKRCDALFAPLSNVGIPRRDFSGPGEVFLTRMFEPQISREAATGKILFHDVAKQKVRRDVVDLIESKEFSLDAIDRLANAIRIRRGRQVRSVFYPAAGFDAGTAFRVFPDADLVIGVDKHPFADWNSGKTTEFQQVRSKMWQVEVDAGWHFVGDVQALGHLSDAIVQSIRKLDSGKRLVRIRRVLAIEGSDTVESRPAIHGIVEFDHGAGTPLRRYVHVHTFASVLKPISDWVLATLATKVDAVFLKAAMGYAANGTSKVGALLSDLRQRNGLIVDTDGSVDSMLKSLGWKSDAVTVTNVPEAAHLGYGEASILELHSETRSQ